MFLVKTDHQLTDNHRLTLRYNHQNFAGEDFENGGAQQSFETTGASKVYTRIVQRHARQRARVEPVQRGARAVGEDREPGEANSENPQADVRQGGTLVLRIGRNFFSPRETTIERGQVADTLTWVRGAHKVKGGFDFQFDDILNFFPGNFSGVYVFQTLARFATGAPTGAGRYLRPGVRRATGPPGRAPTLTSRSTRSSSRTSGGSATR